MTLEPRRTIASMIRADKTRRGRAKAAANRARTTARQPAALPTDSHR